jgi:hypothetical protein
MLLIMMVISSVLFATLSMGGDFLKFQGVLRFALQILSVDNLKGFKTQSTTKNLHQKRKERSGPTMCLLISAFFEFQASV